jgi:hypothetical protein
MHHAPVENREWQISIMAKKKQILFFALYSPTGTVAHALNEMVAALRQN